MTDRSLYVPPADTQDAWDRIDPVEAGWNIEALQNTAGWLGAHDSDAFIVLDRGRIVFEQRWNDVGKASPADVFSAQKSVVSLAVDILAARGLLDIEQPVSTWLGSGWTDTSRPQEEQITLRHLLTMTSGLFDDFGFEAEPDTVWYYNNNAYHQIRRIIETVTGQASNEAFAELIFSPLGIVSSEWRERTGVVDPAGRPLAGLFMTALDLARFGLAVLAGGRWDETDLIDDAAVVGSSLRPSQALNPSFGRLWWLLDQPRGIVPGPPRDGSAHPRKSFGGRYVGHALAPSAPVGTVAAMGAADQRLYLAPDEQVVVVRVGRSIHERTAAASNADEDLWHRLMPALPKGRNHR